MAELGVDIRPHSLQFSPASPRRPWRAVVLTCAWPASCCTVLGSAPASGRSPIKVRRRPRGENGATATRCPPLPSAKDVNEFAQQPGAERVSRQLAASIEPRLARAA